MLTIERQEDETSKYRVENAKHLSPSPNIVLIIQLNNLNYHV